MGFVSSVPIKEFPQNLESASFYLLYYNKWGAAFYIEDSQAPGTMEVFPMSRPIGIGNQDFKKIRENNYFYVDKTAFLREWWESGDEVTLIARPRRFGKTLVMSMVEAFFSVEYANRGDLFEGLSIWEEETYRKLQGTYPVISLSFRHGCGACADPPPSTNSPPTAAPRCHSSSSALRAVGPDPTPSCSSHNSPDRRWRSCRCLRGL